jgi:GT2 family glycosyltransferase
LLQIPEWIDAETVYVDWVQGAALIVRREVVERVGLLSEKLFMYCEDVEWCWRIKQAGWEIAVCRNVSIRHVGGGSSNNNPGRNALIRQSVKNCYVVDQYIKGTVYAKLLVCVRILGLTVESIHPFQSSDHRSVSREALRQNISVLMGRA